MINQALTVWSKHQLGEEECGAKWRARVSVHSQLHWIVDLVSAERRTRTRPCKINDTSPLPLRSPPISLQLIQCSLLYNLSHFLFGSLRRTILYTCSSPMYAGSKRLHLLNMQPMLDQHLYLGSITYRATVIATRQWWRRTNIDRQRSSFVPK